MNLNSNFTTSSQETLSKLVSSQSLSIVKTVISFLMDMLSRTLFSWKAEATLKSWGLKRTCIHFHNKSVGVILALNTAGEWG